MLVDGNAMGMKGCCEEADEALTTGGWEVAMDCGWEAEAITRLRSGGDSVVGRLQQTLRVTSGVVEEAMTMAEGNYRVRRAWVIVRLRLYDDDLFL
ncbi:hypothetical protein BHM03_00042843 [Ensete ventricosum]|nr:hypothetical protein BHM03_00042843 [Ensete ventricosum]